MRRRAALIGAAGAAGALAGGCALWRPTPAPLVQRAFTAGGPAAAPRPLVVLLPGRYMALDELVDHGFTAALPALGVEADLLLVDAHMGYYRERSVVQRLHEDVMLPARRRGVPAVWLAGISLGGMGALLYDDAYPGEAAGLLLLAPYLGEPPTVQAVRAAGGLRQWVPPPATEDDPALGPGPRLWRHLHGLVAQGRPPLYLGFGERDRFAPGLQVLAEALPASHVAAGPGGHDWPAWRPAWATLLERLPLPRR